MENEEKKHPISSDHMEQFLKFNHNEIKKKELGIQQKFSIFFYLH